MDNKEYIEMFVDITEGNYKLTFWENILCHIFGIHYVIQKKLKNEV